MRRRARVTASLVARRSSIAARRSPLVAWLAAPLVAGRSPLVAPERRMARRESVRRADA